MHFVLVTNKSLRANVIAKVERMSNQSGKIVLYLFTLLYSKEYFKLDILQYFLFRFIHLYGILNVHLKKY